MKRLLFLSLFLVFFNTSFAKKYERDYQNEFCINGIKEYRLPDKTRVDCLTEEYAIEIDFAKSGKVFEGISQALYYVCLRLYYYVLNYNYLISSLLH